MNRLRDDLEALLREPFVAEGSFWRYGELVKAYFEARPMGDGKVGLLLRLFPVNMPPPGSPEERLVRLVKLSEALDGLKDEDHHIRCAAANALGQLGAASLGDAFAGEARDALKQAEKDENEWVRREAKKALSLFEAERIDLKALEGLKLCLWHELGGVPQTFTASVDEHGRASFPGIPAGAQCTLATRRPVVMAAVEAVKGGYQGVRGFIETYLSPSEVRTPSVSLALMHAAPVEAEDMEELPYTQEVQLEDGVVVCALYLDREGDKVAEFRSDAASMEGGLVRCTISGEGPEAPSRSFDIPLERDASGVLVGRFRVADEAPEGVLKPRISFEMVPKADEGTRRRE